MKPLHIVLLIAAGAAGGAVLMKMTQKPVPIVEPAVVAQARPAAEAVPHPPAPPAAQPVQAEPAAAAPAAQAEPAAGPSPFQAPPLQTPREAPKPRRVHRTAAPVAIAQTRPSPPAILTPPPSAPVAAAPVAAGPVPAPAPEPAQETPAPQPIPPARPEPENATPAPAPEPHRVTLNAGTLIPVRLVDGLSSERNLPGDTFVATLDKELVADGFVIAERGARVEGRVVSSDRGGKVKGVASMAVELTRVHTADGQNVAVETVSFQKQAEQSRRQDAEKVGAGAAIGAVIGAMGGGGKGAAIGAGAGGGIGAGSVLLTRGDAARLPTETRISFRLRAPVTLTERQR